LNSNHILQLHDFVKLSSVAGNWAPDNLVAALEITAHQVRVRLAYKGSKK